MDTNNDKRGGLRGAMTLALWFLCAGLAGAADKPLAYNRDIRPILSENCFSCHGPDKGTRKVGLRLDERDAALQGVEGRRSIIPGNSAGSELFKRITHQDPTKLMPTPDTGRKLSARQIAILKRWIDEGAKYEAHWALIPPQRVEPPMKSRNPIDAFIQAELERNGMKASPVADRRTLIRRLSFDLTGLPPKPAEVEAFVADQSPDAYERLVDRLLASPHYGERMAVEWLDAARYADTNGYQNDFNRDMWGWRDWVIGAFNRNERYDQFTVEQLAGDLLTNATPDQVIATGFNRNNRSVTEAGSIEAEWLVENLVDRVETMGTAFMGLTLGCARCHDHKFDPVSQKEFFQLYAFFNSTEDRGFYAEARGNTGPTAPVRSLDLDERIKELDAKIAAAEHELNSNRTDVAAAQLKWEQQLVAGPAAEKPAVQFALNGDLGGATLASPVWGVSPTGGKSLKLSGQPTSFAEAGQAFSFERTNAASYGGWVKLDRVNGVQTLLSKMDEAQGYRGFDILIAEGAVMAHIINYWPFNALKITTKQKLDAGKWTHVFVTYDGSSKTSGMRIYFNGEPVETVVEADKLSETIITPQAVHLGKRSANGPLAGELSDIRFYRSALSGAQVTGVYGDAFHTIARLPAGQRTEAQKSALATFFRNDVDGASSAAGPKLTALKKERQSIQNNAATVMVMKEAAKPRPTYLLMRGQYDKPDKTEILQPDVPASLPPLPKDAPRNRLTFARWLVDPKNPLPARVAVNRFWAQCFGSGIVKSVENLGMQAEWPSHPELLDWLATEFVRTGWDMKGLMKLIVTSDTYRQSSASTADLRERDPENRLLARGPRFRLPAEFIRDNALAVSGLLSGNIGGPSVRPYQPPGLWEQLGTPGMDNWKYRQDTGDKLYRRSMYTFWKRPAPPTTMSTFDAPSREVCRVKRSRTNTPLQALALLNDTTYVEAARQLAQKMITEGGTAAADRIRYGFVCATARPPSDSEFKILSDGLAKYTKTYTNDTAAAAKLIAIGDTKPDAKLAAPELAAYTTVASIILNLDEMITKE